MYINMIELTKDQIKEFVRDIARKEIIELSKIIPKSHLDSYELGFQQGKIKVAKQILHYIDTGEYVDD